VRVWPETTEPKRTINFVVQSLYVAPLKSQNS
jgi:hypothetical protein